MKGQLTRRQMAGAVLATAAAAQTPTAAPQNPPSDMDAVRQQNQRAADSLAKTEIAMDIEPAFRFTA